jgi:hypothetical protein
MKDSGVLDKTVLVYGQMNESPGARMRVALSALTIAEHFRDVDRQDVLLSATLEEITEKLYFDYSSEKIEGALYSEMIPGATVQVCLNQSGEESKVNMEALFNTVHIHKELIKGIFNK